MSEAPVLHGGGSTLLVASTGGHLEQLFRLKDRFLEPGTRVEWATFDEPQSRSLLSDQVVNYVRYIAPRDYRSIAANVRPARQLLASRRFDRVVSTGSGIALAFLPVARAHGIDTHYIESAARADGPSVTGRLLARVPGINLYSQYPSWAGERKWKYRGSLFDSYSVQPRPGAKIRPDRVVVTLGTMRTFGFRRAVDAARRVLAELGAGNAEVLWQVGATNIDELPIQGRNLVPKAEMKAAMADADLIIAHAGIGSALDALDLGRCPVLLSRRKAFGEHIDDHQRLIARELDGRGLSVSRDPDELTVTDVVAAMSRVVHRFPGEYFRLETKGRTHPA